MIFTQQYVGDMCESIEYMKLTPAKKELVQAAMRAAIDYANAKNHMHASPNARAVAAAVSRPSLSTPESK